MAGESADGLCLCAVAAAADYMVGHNPVLWLLLDYSYPGHRGREVIPADVSTSLCSNQHNLNVRSLKDTFLNTSKWQELTAHRGVSVKQLCYMS